METSRKKEKKVYPIPHIASKLLLIVLLVVYTVNMQCKLKGVQFYICSYMYTVCITNYFDIVVVIIMMLLVIAKENTITITIATPINY